MACSFSSVYPEMTLLNLSHSQMRSNPNSPASSLQDIINNTSLAELEKRLKETPFDPPRVGKNVSPENLQTLEITNMFCAKNVIHL